MFKSPILLFALASVFSLTAFASEQENNTPVDSSGPAAHDVILIQEDPGSRTPEARTERIQITEDLVQVDELRVRGETQSIEVTPRGSLPSYEVIPQDASQQPGSNNTSGQRVWRIRF